METAGAIVVGALVVELVVAGTGAVAAETLVVGAEIAVLSVVVGALVVSADGGREVGIADSDAADSDGADSGAVDAGDGTVVVPRTASSG